MSITRPRSCGFLRNSLLLLAGLVPFHFQVIHAQTLPVGSTSTPQTALITFTAAGEPATIAVLTQGAPNLDFKFVAGGSCSTSITYAVGNSCTVKYTVTPTAPGQRLGAVQLIDGSGSVALGTALLAATGIGPAVVFPGPQNDTSVFDLNELRSTAVDSVGNFYFTTFSAIYEYLSGSDSFRQISCNCNDPYGLAIDGAGNIYVADSGNRVIKEILAVGGVLSIKSPVIVLAALPGFPIPNGIAVDAKGNVFFAYANSVQEIVAIKGAVSPNSAIIQVGSGLFDPTGPSVAPNGDVYVAAGARVLKIVAVNGVVSSTSTVVPLAVDFNFSYALSTALDAAGNVYVANAAAANEVYEILAVDGVVSQSSKVIGLGNSFSPTFVNVDSSGNLLGVPRGSNYIRGVYLSHMPSTHFADTNINTTSTDSPRATQVQNIGNAPLDITGFTTSHNFAIDHAATTCSTSVPLASSALCSLGIDFTPTTNGVVSGNLTLGDNELYASGGYFSLSPKQSYLLGSGFTLPADPVLSAGTGTYKLPMQVTITESVPGSTLYYIVNEGKPIVYTGPITISEIETIRTYAISDDGYRSNTLFAAYNTHQPPPAAPVISPDGGTFDYSVQVSITSATPNARIYYLLSGSNKPILYTKPFRVYYGTTSVTAVAVGNTNADWSESTPTSASFTFTNDDD